MEKVLVIFQDIIRFTCLLAINKKKPVIVIVQKFVSFQKCYVFKNSYLHLTAFILFYEQM